MSLRRSILYRRALKGIAGSLGPRQPAVRRRRACRKPRASPANPDRVPRAGWRRLGDLEDLADSGRDRRPDHIRRVLPATAHAGAAETGEYLIDPAIFGCVICTRVSPTLSAS